MLTAGSVGEGQKCSLQVLLRQRPFLEAAGSVDCGPLVKQRQVLLTVGLTAAALWTVGSTAAAFE